MRALIELGGSLPAAALALLTDHARHLSVAETLERGQVEKTFDHPARMVYGFGAANGASEGAGRRWAPEITVDNVAELFAYQPWVRSQMDAGAVVVEALVAAAKAALRHVPDGPDRAVGLRKLREARMDFNSAITHGGRF